MESRRFLAAASHLNNIAAAIGLNSFHTFKATKGQTDEFAQTHVSFQQQFKGIPVMDGNAIVHLDADENPLPITDSLVREIITDVNPKISGDEAMAIATAALHPKGAYSVPPTADLVIYPLRQLRAKPGVEKPSNALDFDRQVIDSNLAYHVHTSLRNPSEIKDINFIISAIDGKILQTWNDLHEDAATGTGISQYNGTASIPTSTFGSGFSLTDLLHGGTMVSDMANETVGTGALFTSSSNTWGTGQNFFDDGSTGNTFGSIGQTAAVDALVGLGTTWNFYGNVFGRNGIDGTGRATLMRVHYGQNLKNAFWDSATFSMAFGDGDSTGGYYKDFTSPDVVGHELSHGVCANNGLGGLTYLGESGGLNEANSDIMGTFIVYYGYNGGNGSSVPNSIPSWNLHGYTPWTIGSQLAPQPMRFMYKPSMDGISPDYWSSDLSRLDVHYASGPANHMMYFLTQGASPSGNTSSAYLPSGMSGIGNDHACRIWYRALTTYFTPGETYAQCRYACLNAALDLYGWNTTDFAAVQNAFAGVNVGNPAQDPFATVNVTLAANPKTELVTGYYINIAVQDYLVASQVECWANGIRVGVSTTGTATYGGSGQFGPFYGPRNVGTIPIQAIVYDRVGHSTTSTIMMDTNIADYNN
jgi:Zn-dependent metalloprotease